MSVSVGAKPSDQELVVRLDRMIYSAPLRNETDKHYSVWAIETEDGAQATAVAEMPGQDWGLPGDSVTLMGTWVESPKHGRQFQTSALWPHVPSGSKGLIRWLSDQEGIGPVSAEKVAQALGADALTLLKEQPELVDTIPDLRDAQRVALREAIRRYEAEQAEADVKIFCRRHGLGPVQAAVVWRRFKSRAIGLLSAQPWALTDLDGFGFLTADAMAMHLRVDPTSADRLRASVQHVLMDAREEGHVYLPYGELVSRTVKLLTDIARKTGYGAGDPLALPQAVTQAVDTLILGDNLILENGNVYRKDLYYHEKAVREWLTARRSTTGLTSKEKAAAMVTSLVAKRPEGRRLDDVQMAGVVTALCSGAAALSGPPGSGKTTTIDVLLDAIRTCRPGADVRMAAPTGRAARRMMEVTGQQAETIHRLLEFGRIDHGDGGVRYGFQRNADNQLEGEYLIVDESSMADLPLVAALLEAIPDDMPVLFVGDADQLPPVGPGAPYHAITGQALLPMVRLERIYRQGAGSPIPMAARTVNRGEMPQEVAGDRTFRILLHDRPPRNLPAKAREDAGREIRRRMADDVLAAVVALRDKYGYAPADIQVLTPIRRGPCGTAELNGRLREQLNPSGRYQGIFVAGASREFWVGDRVMQLVNDYEKMVFNGEQGVVTHVNVVVDTDTWRARRNPDGTVMAAGGATPMPSGCKAGIIVVFDEDKEVGYTAKDASDLDLAYAVTVHKSQGSEYPAVVMVQGWDAYTLLQRQLLYTGMTRASRHLILIAEQGTIEQAIETLDGVVRYQNLGAPVPA